MKSARRESHKLMASAVAVFVVFVLCVAYLIGGVMQTPLTSRPDNVTVELRATGGLFQGSLVTYRGYKVGKISHIGFTPDGVAATARIDDSVKIPAGTRAVVRSLSPVGEQYLDFQPSSAAGPYLHDGSTITASHTDIPQTLAQTVISLNKLLGQIDPNKLHTVLTVAHRALQGTGPDLARMIRQGRLVINDLNRYWPQTKRLLVNGGTLLRIGSDNAATLARLARNLRLFAGFLHRELPELRRALARSPHEIGLLQQLLRDVQGVTPEFLRLGSRFTALQAAYAPHLRVLLADFAPGLGVLGKAVWGGTMHLDLIGQRDTLCDYPGQPPDPHTRVPMNPHHHCPDSFPLEQRGAAHAPGPVPVG
ncbi:MAG: MlaD family protein [Marmoricola sp.]